MASSSSSNPNTTTTTTTTNNNNNVGIVEPSTTTYVQAEPSNFRAVVQKLTGASPDSSAHKLPVTLPSRLAAGKSGEVGPRRPAFKLQERRQSSRKLEIKLNNNINGVMGYSCFSQRQRMITSNNINGGAMASPVSPLDLLLTRGSPRTPMSAVEEEEERAIAEKGFYLHPSPLTKPGAGGGADPELLTLFPLHSPNSQHNSPPNSYTALS